MTELRAALDTLEQKVSDLEPVLLRATNLLERSVTLLAETRQLLRDLRDIISADSEDTVVIDVEMES